MDFFDSLDNVKYHAGRLFWPIAFMITGIILLYIGVVGTVEELNNTYLVEVSPDVFEEVKEVTVPQSQGFTYAALFFIVAGAIWFLYLFDLVKSFVGYAVVAILVVSGIFLIYTDYKTIDDTLKFNAAVELRDNDIIARMGDLKEAQLAYKESNGVYTDNMDSLIYFVKNGKKMKITKTGSIPNRRLWPAERDYLYNDKRPIDKLMTEVEAAALAKTIGKDSADFDGFKRDTSYISVLEAVFNSKKYIENRKKKNASLDFHPDSLRYVPHSKNKVYLEAGFVEKEEVKFPRIYIEMQHPMKEDLKKEEDWLFTIGDPKKRDNTLTESWKDRIKS